MGSKQIIIDIACLDEGIVPLGSQGVGHIIMTLNALPPAERRRTTRKFRKILKKAIHAEALASGPKDSTAYQHHKKFLYKIAGLRPGTSRKRNAARCRMRLVRDYLSTTHLTDN
jgi:hypothetical protein